jgi:hemoglobin
LPDTYHTAGIRRDRHLKFYEVRDNLPGSTPLGLEEAHRKLKISPAEFDEVAAELARTLDVFKVPEREKGEVLGAFAAHKDEVTRGYTQ